MNFVGSDGRWRHIDNKGRHLWPRTFHDDHGVTHVVFIYGEGYMEGPVIACSGHRAHRTGIDEHHRPVTCLTCVVRSAPLPEDVYDDEA